MRKRAEEERERLMIKLRETAAAAEQNRAQLEAVFQAMSEGVMIFDMAANAVFVNEAEARIIGFPNAEDMKRNLAYFTEVYELSHPDGRPVPPDDWPVWRVLRGESVVNWELRGRRKDSGREWFFSFTAEPVRDEHGKQILAVLITHDITERKRRDEEFKKISRQNELILQFAGDGIFGLDVQGNVTFINAVAAHTLGYESGELLGKHSHFTWHYRKPDGTAYPAEECPIYAAYKEGVVHSGEEVFWRKNNTGFPIEYTSRPLYEEGKIAGSVVTYKDITERKRSEDELKRLLSELERSNKELEQFAYIASHDLQEPLRMVASYVQLLEKKYQGRFDEKADKYIYFAVDGVKRMQKLIDGLLAYSRVPRGGQFTRVDANQAFSHAVANLSIAIKESGAVVTRDDLPAVFGDEIQLSQLFQNLIGNAIKFRRAEVAPVVRVSSTKDGDHWIFSVSDNGIGMDPEYFDRVFLIFQRLHAREEYPGTGIGLALCKRIVERHHGRIWVESTPGKGSIFFFTIPSSGGQK
jgi:PAS domain S-box-containing protein